MIFVLMMRHILGRRAVGLQGKVWRRNYSNRQQARTDGYPTSADPSGKQLTDPSNCTKQLTDYLSTEYSRIWLLKRSYLHVLLFLTWENFKNNAFFTTNWHCMYNSEYKKQETRVVDFVCTLLLWNCGRCEISRRSMKLTLRTHRAEAERKEKRNKAERWENEKSEITV